MLSRQNVVFIANWGLSRINFYEQVPQYLICIWRVLIIKFAMLMKHLQKIRL